MILYPYICKENDNKITFGWNDRSGNVFCNIENSEVTYGDFVVGFKEYNEDGYKELWDNFMKKINEQDE